MFKKSIFLQIIFSCLVCVNVNAQEAITRYNVNIHINSDGSLIIHEKIKVRSKSNQIKRGIYRDFPLIYKDNYNHTVKAGFDIISALRDGRKEPYHTKNIENGIRIYLGDKDTFIPPGMHTYELTFRTTRQLGFFESRDELYFNAIGHGWIFPIYDAKIKVFLPKGVRQTDVELNSWTGKAGSKESALKSTLKEGLVAVFRLEEPLSKYEGATIYVSWPKGFVTEPTYYDKVQNFLSDNLSTLVGFLGLMALLNYYYLVWSKVGKDPEKGTIVAQYESPNDLKPWEAAYIMEMGFTNRCLSSFITDLAIRGHISISEFNDVYTLEKLKNSDDVLDTTEASALQELFPSGKTSLEIGQTNYKELLAVKKLIKTQIESKHLNKSIFMNRSALVVGLALEAVVLIAMVVSSKLSSFQDQMATPTNFALIGVLTILPLLFNKLLKRPSIYARKIMDHLEGQKMYLETAEQDRFRSAQPMTTDIYEQFLPIAIALGVEKAWTNKLQSALPESEQNNYNPHWYRGSNSYLSTNRNSSNFAQTFSSLIASSSSPPGSSSGSGGSSGGGGGGGGGGGW